LNNYEFIETLYKSYGESMLRKFNTLTPVLLI